MNLDELKSLDFEDPGSWPVAAKAIAAGAVAVAILVVGYFLKTKDQLQQLDTLKKQEVTLFQEFQQKHQKAAKLEEYQAQLEEMKQILETLLRQLPSKTEMPDLLQDVSQTAIATGIDIGLFRPQPEIVRDFYAEKPIELRMQGAYHQFGEFVSAVASLERVIILTMHDINLQPVSGSGNQLTLSGTVKTYRYLDADEGGGQ